MASDSEGEDNERKKLSNEEEKVKEGFRSIAEKNRDQIAIHLNLTQQQKDQLREQIDKILEDDY